MILVWFTNYFFELNHFTVSVGYLQFFKHQSSASYKRDTQQKSTKAGRERSRLSWIDLFGNIPVGIRTV